MGAFTNEGLFWIKKNGDIFPVNVPPYENFYSHEEYAEQKWNMSLEKALRIGNIRIQSIKNDYLFIDHRQSEIKGEQAKSLERFFYDGLNPINYNKFVVERKNSDMREFSSGQSKSALSFALDGSVGDDNEDFFNKALAKRQREKEIAGMSSYYQRLASPIGDSFKPIGFKTWVENKRT